MCLGNCIHLVIGLKIVSCVWVLALRGGTFYLVVEVVFFSRNFVYLGTRSTYAPFLITGLVMEGLEKCIGCQLTF